MGALAAEDSSEQFWRSTLWQHRRELKELLENWGKMAYEDKDSVVHDYFYFLYTTIHKDRSDVNADLRILEDLQTLLEDNIVDEERNYTQYQVALIHILKKIGMMFQELRCILKEGIVSPDDEIGKWIEDQLHNEEREGYPNYVHGFERQVVKQANAIGIPINEEIITFKEIRNGKPHEIKDRLMVYYKELEKAHNMPQDNVDWISRGPEMCEFTKEMISELSHRYLVKPDDDIKGDRRDGVRTTIQAVDSSKCLLKCGAYSQFSPSTTSTNHRDQEKEETMDAAAAAPAKSKAGAEDLTEQIWRSRLRQYRHELKDLLENWGKLAYEDKDLVVHDYLYFLYTTIHKDRGESDVNADLRILEDLQTLLQQNIDDGERNYTQNQVALIHALKKIGMMLQELRCILKEGIVSPDDELGKWIEDQLRNEEREGYLNYVHGFERQVVKQANATGIPINEEIITFKEIRNEKPHEIKDRLMMYHKELEKADNMPQDNVDCISRGPEMCEFIKEMISELSR